jgi:hypothetical protein
VAAGGRRRLAPRSEAAWPAYVPGAALMGYVYEIGTNDGRVEEDPVSRVAHLASAGWGFARAMLPGQWVDVIELKVESVETYRTFGLLFLLVLLLLVVLLAWLLLKGR